jgi:hypothetical protein
VEFHEDTLRLIDYSGVLAFHNMGNIVKLTFVGGSITSGVTIEQLAFYNSETDTFYSQ